MITILLRTIIIYILLIFSMRLLGKRQLGELEISELITTILISEIAAMPIADHNIPLSYAIIPLITIMTFEIAFSFLLCKFPSLKNSLSSPPSTLIYNGKINQAELLKNRISSEELISELRLKNVTDPSNVQYAILEQNGMLSVIPKPANSPPTVEQLGVTEDASGIVHIIISQGVWNEHNLQLLCKPKSLFSRYLQKKNLSLRDVFLLTVDDSNTINLVVKEKQP